ncbi:MAG: hypothetical protein ABIO79_14090, partial [Ferruginibacter sp.]
MSHSTVPLKGFFTKQIYLQGQTLVEIERRLGFDSGRLSQGAWFAAATVLPNPHEFEFAGYSQVAGHHTSEQYGDINNPKNKHEEDAYILQKKAIINTWKIYGSDRLVKVIPMIGHSYHMGQDYQYPPGSGIPQWRIISPIYCKGICM